ncbi:hypothetical protein SteCoe_14245 [Stentor coeruleus]|uniref:Uncharacterized protein n=1 Tax=Stentor coeruleus TaxID=5963 RepID=A0A1R2C6L8_9CILI|nr:hypothetical protein SteCoe_14245 [Stentor coeruleus]
MDITDELKQTVLELNRNAMSLLKNNAFSDALILFKKAMKIIKLTKDCELKFKLLGINQNNLGCYFKRMQKPKTALKHLKKACENEKKADIDNVNRAGTYLNICAILSALGKHKMALEESQKALDLLEKAESSPNLAATLVIAYHNIGVEYEFLRIFQKSLEFYSLAYETAIKELGNNHSLTKSTKLDYDTASAAIYPKELPSTMRSIEIKDPLSVSFNKKPNIKKHKNIKKAHLEELQAMPYNNLKFNKKYQKSSLRQVITPIQTKFEKQFMRYITGERLKPMFEVNSFRIKSLPISPIKQARVHSPSLPLENHPNNRNVSTAPLEERKRIRQKPKIIGKETFMHKKPQIDTLRIGLSPQKKIESTPKFSENDEIPKTLSQSPQQIKEKTIKAIEELETLKTQAKLERILNSSTSIYEDNEEKKNNLEKSLAEIKDLKQKNQEEMKENLENFRMNENNLGIEKAQGVFRGYLDRKKYKKIIGASIVIQRNVRRIQCQKIYTGIRNAAVVIQRWYKKQKSKNLV